MNDPQEETILANPEFYGSLAEWLLGEDSTPELWRNTAEYILDVLATAAARGGL